ncbi:MAG: adenylate/guanylate cyclase domain-containing protein [Candidatus Rokubacteria bacterium]|nr:adenylate/guanylate cyclase domain-containing protein [Candidatus Rokubacteria bacterium]
MTARDRLMQELIAHPEREADIERRIRELFGQDRAVMVLDMSGFSRTTRRLGIVSFLGMIHRMRGLAVPCVEAARGSVVKTDTDNLFCLFETVDDAVAASGEIIERLDAANTVLPEARRLYVSMGIGYGHVLNVDGHDLFGEEVNLASKLGEDIATMREVLLTAGAHARLTTSVAVREECVSISGLALTYYRVERA